MSYITINVKNDSMLGKMNDSSVATKLYVLEKQLDEKDKEIEQLNKEKSILEKALRLVLQHEDVIDYDELDKANKMVEKYNKELKEGKK